MASAHIIHFIIGLHTTAFVNCQCDIAVPVYGVKIMPAPMWDLLMLVQCPTLESLALDIMKECVDHLPIRF